MMETNKCIGCGSNTNLGLINCRHESVCLKCAKPMAERKEQCRVCGVAVTILHKEFAVRLCSADDKKKYFAGSFKNGAPDLANDHQWSLVKQSQSSDANAEVLNKDPWILENQEGIKYKGNLVGKAKRFFLQEEDDGSSVLIPCDNWFGFDRVPPPGTQRLTTEQAEQIMDKKRNRIEETIQKRNKRMRTTGKVIKPTTSTSTSTSTGETVEKGEPWDHDARFSDDDVGSDSEESISVPSAIKEFEEKDNEPYLSNAGRDLKNILRKYDDGSDKDDGKGSGSTGGASTST